MSDTQEQERDSGHVDQAGESGSEASSEGSKPGLKLWVPDLSALPPEWWLAVVSAH